MCPVILLHGLFGFQRIKVGPVALDYFLGIEKALAARGHPVLATRVHPTASIARRAQQAKDAILPWLEQLGPKTPRAIVIAHSMGGLDARFMIAHLGMAQRVAALVTLATPHHGTALADFWLGLPPVQRMALPLCQHLGWDVEGPGELTTAAAPLFNQRVPDSPLVRYFSISACCPPSRVPLPLQLGYWVVRQKEGDNDGLVSVQSALWGEHLGTWPVHHFHAVNRRFPIDCLCPVGNIAPMYLKVLEDVQERANLRAQGSA